MLSNSPRPSSFTRHRARPITLASAFAATILLSGCSLLSAAGDAAPASTDGVEHENGRYEALDLGAPPTDMIKPGTELALGEAAWVEVTTPGDSEDDPETSEPFGLAVLDIVEGDPSYFDRYENADEFEGDVPYFIVTQQTRPNQLGTESLTSESFWPILANGDSADMVGMFGTISGTDCEFVLPELDLETGTTVSCLVAIGTPENAVTSVNYDGLGQFTMFFDETDIYAENPIVWS